MNKVIINLRLLPTEHGTNLIMYENGVIEMSVGDSGCFGLDNTEDYKKSKHYVSENELSFELIVDKISLKKIIEVYKYYLQNGTIDYTTIELENGFIQYRIESGEIMGTVYITEDYPIGTEIHLDQWFYEHGSFENDLKYQIKIMENMINM